MFGIVLTWAFCTFWVFSSSKPNIFAYYSMLAFLTSAFDRFVNSAEIVIAQLQCMQCRAHLFFMSYLLQILVVLAQNDKIDKHKLLI